MSHPFVLFEVSWEVCNMVGGIHTVISTKARTASERLGDDYIAVGPWLLSESDRGIPFDDEPGHEEFCEACRSQGLPVRVGRWRTPGTPLTILVEFSRLYEHKDDVLADLWEQYGVDSISGGWDYTEPVLFGHAAGMVIERWWEEHLAPKHRRAIVHAHEWMTGASLLYLKRRLPSVGTVFTTHATMLGRALSSLGHSPSDGLGDQSPADLAEEHGVVAKHSLEGICAREADVFTTVSQITADEAALLHDRRPDPLLPNGIDLHVMDDVAGPADRETVRERLFEEAGRFLGEDVSDAALLCVSGRYEFHNKGMDLLLEALARLEGESGRRVVLFILVPAGNSGVRSEVLERRARSLDDVIGEGPVGIATHNLFDEEHDPVLGHCRTHGLENASASRIKVVQVPVYLGAHDGFLDLPYEAVLRAMDLSCFPSYYEPWGYTPQESLAVGVPTITSDYAGFGRWAKETGLGAEDGITVLPRVRRAYETSIDRLARVISNFLEQAGPIASATADTCRATATRTAWSDLFGNYETAYANALSSIEAREAKGTPQQRRRRRRLPVRESRAQTPRLTPFDVAPSLPAPLAGLERLAENYWWSWDSDATSLFAELAPATWEACGHNPVALLQEADAKALAERSADASYVERIDRALARRETYLGRDRLCRLGTGEGDERDWVLSNEHPVAYFSAEFGIHESLPIYGGGLGVLAGDHLKSASDIGLPLVGVGLFYRMGYVPQRLTASGEQTEVDRENDVHRLPLECVRSAEGAPLEVRIQLPGRTLHLRAWRVRVGRVSLYLLDANTPSNEPEDRDITRRLYGGDEETRILQEIVLGRGGARLLRKLWIRPAVWHLNEGHAAFLSLERVSRLMREEGLTFDAAREIVRATTAFTTHTPVPAGHDRFNEDLMRRYFSDAETWVGVPWERFFDLGRADDGQFNMTWLALSFASRVNGVSKLHETASKKLLKPFWPGLLEEEVPVSSVTNGIHLPSWTHARIQEVVGAKGDGPIAPETFAKASANPKALWRARTELKRALVETARASLERSFLARSDSPLMLHRTLAGLDPDALFIGFARRFAPYKRAHLLFQDIERLARLLGDEERPVRILIAGKAHPRDERGKDILREISELTRSDELVGRVVFLEDYDIGLARALVQGVDVWLNTPTRMQEASGTSGMKAAANGVLNLSIGDGWWPEAHDGENGWMIARGRLYEDQALQDQFDGAALYQLLEEEVVPLFFQRDRGGTPKAWLERVQRDLETIAPVFNTDRMVREYFDAIYRGLGRNYYEYVLDKKAKPKRLGVEAQRIRRGFDDIKVVEARIADLSELHTGEPIHVRLDLELGSLRPDDVRVELVLGRSRGETLRDPVAVPLAPAGSDNGTVTYEGSHHVEGAGHFAHGLRVRAIHADRAGGSLKDLVFWA